MNTPQDTRNEQSETRAGDQDARTRLLLHRVLILVMVGLVATVVISAFGVKKAIDTASDNRVLIIRVTHDEKQLKAVTDRICGHSPKGAKSVRQLAIAVRQILVISTTPPPGRSFTKQQRRDVTRFLLQTLPLINPITHYQSVKC